jgi:hypothetical protein
MTIPAGAITPGSTAYGDRKKLESGLKAVGGGAPTVGGGAAPSPAPSPTTTMPDIGNPLSDMLAGRIKTGSGPLTSGMSVGPGNGPAGQLPSSPTDNDLGHKLKMLATQSTSPTLRRLAAARLKRMYRGVDSG